MKQENLDIILNELDRRGFSDQLLAEEIKWLAAYNLPVFSLKRQKQFGGERIDYRLIFQWNDPELKYELKSIGVWHRMDVNFEPVTYLGIDIAALDKKMASINWEEYWELAKKGISLAAVITDDINSSIKAISDLLHEGNTEVQLIAEELMYKYFPAEIFVIFAPKPERLSRFYEHSFTFDLEHYPNISAEIAYLLITEKADSLESQLDEFLPDQISDSEIRNEIYNKMGSIPQEALLDFNWITKDGSLVELSVPVTKKDNWYGIDLYQLSVRQLPEIPKGTFNKVDAKALNQKMEKIDWKDNVDLVFIKNDEDIGFDQEAEFIQEELFRMALVPEGKQAADLLMLKYFYAVPFFEDQIRQEAYQLLENLPSKIAYLTPETSVDNALNLIKGNPVLINRIVHENNPGEWLRMEFPGQDMAGELITFTGISMSELRKLVSVLPVDVNDLFTIEEKLIGGESIVVESKLGKPISIKMTQDADRIMICDVHEREIPFNFRLDPDWIPKEVQITNAHSEQKQQTKGHEKKTAGNKRKRNSL